MIRILLLIVLGIGISASAVGDPAKDLYRPYVHPFPQIIQASDYQTIEAIETFESKLKAIRGDAAACSKANDILLHANYSDPKTAALFATLKRLLGDLSHNQTCRAVGFDQSPTPAYARRTIVEFDFGSTVIVVDAFSNGPANLERLYILDTIEPAESFFWGRPQ